MRTYAKQTYRTQAKLRLEPHVRKHTSMRAYAWRSPHRGDSTQGTPLGGYPLRLCCLPAPQRETNRQQISCCRRVRIPGPSQTRNPEKQKQKAKTTSPPRNQGSAVGILYRNPVLACQMLTRVIEMTGPCEMGAGSYLSQGQRS